MQIKYIETKAIDEEFIDNYKWKNGIEFNIYGRYENLLFLNKGDYIRIYDIDKKDFAQHFFMYGNNIHYVKTSHDNYCFFQYHQDEDSKVDSICIYDEKLKVKKFLSLKEHSDFGLKLNMECLSSNDTEERYNVTWLYYETPRSSYRIHNNIDFIINKKNDIEVATSSLQLKEQTEKINNYYIDMQKERILTDKWDGMSKFKYKMAIITKNNQYGVINDNYEIIFDYSEDIIFIKILSFDTILIENKNNEKFLYNINTKEMIKYSKKIQLDDIKMLKENIYRKQINDKYELYIDNKLYAGIYDDIYTKDNLEIIILEQNGKTTFIDTKGKILLKLNDNNYFICSNEIYYEVKNEVLIFNLENLQSKFLGDSHFQTDDGKTVSCKGKKTFQKYKYYYNDPETGKIVLCQNMKYGIIIEVGDIKIVRWFDSDEKRNEIHKFILEDMFSFVEDLPKIKKLKLQ